MNYSDKEKEAINRLYDVTHQTNGKHVNYIDINNICVDEDDLESCEGFCKATDIVLNLIQKQEEIIDKMAEKINQAYFDKENMYIWFEEKILPKDEFGLCEYKDLGTRKTRIKEYFKKEVKKDVKD